MLGILMQNGALKLSTRIVFVHFKVFQNPKLIVIAVHACGTHSPEICERSVELLGESSLAPFLVITF